VIRYTSEPERQLAQLRRDIADAMTVIVQACDPKTPSCALCPSEVEDQTKKAPEKAGKPDAKCETKVHGGGGAVTVCE